MKKYSIEELRIINNALNVLIKNSDKTEGVKMNVFHYSRFHNRTHYIDFDMTLKKFAVYKHYDGYTYPNEKF